MLKKILSCFSFTLKEWAFVFVIAACSYYPINWVYQYFTQPNAKALLAKAEAGDSQMQYEVGQLYATGKGVLKQDDKQALAWYQKAANAGHGKAQFQLGYSYWTGRGVEKNLEQGFEWIEKAAMQGVPEAQLAAGMFRYYHHGRFSYAQAAEFLEPAAKSGVAQAQFYFGTLYDKGLDRPRDIHQAIEWYEKAAAGGNDDAKMRLGTLYLMGFTEEHFYDVNEEDTLVYFLKNMADIVEGKELNENVLKGKAWLEQVNLKELTWADNQFPAGFMSHVGVVFPKDEDQAMFYFFKAMFNGQKQALEISMQMMQEDKNMERSKRVLKQLCDEEVSAACVLLNTETC